MGPRTAQKAFPYESVYTSEGGLMMQDAYAEVPVSYTHLDVYKRQGLYCVGTMIGDFFAGTYNFGLPGQNLGACCCTLPYVLGRDLAKL